MEMHKTPNRIGPFSGNEAKDLFGSVAEHDLKLQNNAPTLRLCVYLCVIILAQLDNKKGKKCSGTTQNC